MFRKWMRSAALTVTMISLPLAAQAPVVTIDQPHTGDRNVSGKALPGSGPLTVYEMKGATKSYLGKGNSLDQQGYYAIPVNPPLAEGQKLVVVDFQGQASSVQTVTTVSGPAGPAD